MITKNFIKLLFISLQFIYLSMVAQTEVKGPYFGQTPPGTTPELFAPGILTVPGGLVAVSRIAFSPDGKECFFSGPVDWSFSSTRMYHTKCIDSVWTDHELVSFFPGYSCRQPYFSADGDTLYFCSNKNGSADIWKVARTPEGWGTPEVLPDPINDGSSYDGMYTQSTNGTAYIESMRSGGKGKIDVWRITSQTDQPLKVENLVVPVNTTADNNDPFISPNGRYMILGSDYNDLYVTFNKENGNWTGLINLNEFCPGANTGEGQEYAPYITADGKYLFFNRIYKGELYWVSTRNIDSLENINIPPYLKEPIPDQTVIKGSMFNYQIPDGIFIDDDGNNTLTYAATLSNGDAIPQNLVNFDPDNRIFSGIPDTAGSFTIKVTVTDTANASDYTRFNLIVENNTATAIPVDKKNILIYPNPTFGLVNISFGNTMHQQVVAELFDITGILLIKEDLSNRESASFNLTGRPKGTYILKLSIDENIIMDKFCLE